METICMVLQLGNRVYLTLGNGSIFDSWKQYQNKIVEGTLYTGSTSINAAPFNLFSLP
jgi:hypothetical protein